MVGAGACRSSLAACVPRRCKGLITVQSCSYQLVKERALFNVPLTSHVFEYEPNCRSSEQFPDIPRFNLGTNPGSLNCNNRMLVEPASRGITKIATTWQIWRACLPRFCSLFTNNSIMLTMHYGSVVAPWDGIEF